MGCFASRSLVQPAPRHACIDRRDRGSHRLVHYSSSRILVPPGTHDGRSNEAGFRFILGRIRRVPLQQESDIPRHDVRTPWLGGFLYERPRLRPCSGLCGLHQPFPDRARGACSFCHLRHRVRILPSEGPQVAVGHNNGIDGQRFALSLINKIVEMADIFLTA